MGKWGSGGTQRIALAMGVTLALAIACTACGSAARADELPVTSAIPAAATKIRVMVYNGAYTSLPVFIARDTGFYEKYHLDPELTVVASGPAGVAALLGGSLDFIEPPTDQIIENQVRGSDLRIVVGNEVRNFFDVVATTKLKLPHEAAGYPAIMQDLKGLRIGVNALGASTHLMMNALLKGAGLTPDDVTYVADGSSNTALAAWQADRIDAQVAFTPFPEIVQALGSGRSIINLSAGQGPALLQKLGGAFEDWSTSAAYIRAHPDIVNAFIKAHVEAIAWIKDPANRDRLTALIGKYVNTAIIPEDRRAQTVALMIDDYNNYFGSAVDRAAIEAWNQYLLDNKLIPHAVAASDVIYAGAPKP